MTVANLTLLGAFGLTHDGRAVDIGGQKERALLAVLALSAGIAQPRDKLATLLWGDHGEVQARDSLKHALHRLRQGVAEMNPTLVTADRQAVTLDPAGITIDVRRFEQAIAEGTPAALHQAVLLYAGDFLEGIGVRDRSFEDWLLIERRRLRQLAETALVTLLQADLPEKTRENMAVKLLALDPLREAAHRSLMQLHVLRGETAQAMKLYETLRDKLHAELGVKPEAVTVQLFETIRRQETRTPATVPSLASLDPASSMPSPALPAKPSIAVLPFQNLSDDPGQAYFADGMAEEIITALSRMRWLFVIARNSSFAFRGKAVDIKHIGEQLGVRYILEGSVRKAANKVRIMGQLIDATTGAHIWADRFEGELADVFDLQDRVTSSVVGAISPKLEQAEMERAKRKPTDSLDAYDLYLRGMSSVYRWTKDGLEEGLRLFYKAIDQDADFAAAYGVAAWCYYWRMVSGWMIDRPTETAEVARLVGKVSEIGKDDAVSLAFSGAALGYVVGDAPTSLAHIDRALVLNPNLAAAWSASGFIQALHGDPDMAVEHFARAMRLSPLDPLKFFMQSFTGFAHFIAGRYDLAWPIAEAACRDQANFLGGLRIAAVSNVMAGRQVEAEHFIAQALRLDPDLRIANLGNRFNHIRPAYFAKYVEALRRAGLPE